MIENDERHCPHPPDPHLPRRLIYLKKQEADGLLLSPTKWLLVFCCVLSGERVQYAYPGLVKVRLITGDNGEAVNQGRCRDLFI